MSDAIFDGPIIDTHFHLWDYALGVHPWLAPAPTDDGLGALRKSHLPADYEPLAKAAGIVASVHIEANWRPDDPVAETAWLTGLNRPKGVGDRLVVHVPLLDPRAESMLEQQIAFDDVVGVRDILTWHPDPAWTRVDSNTRMDDPLFRRHFARLSKLGLHFELMISPWQAAEAFRLAAEFSDTVFVLNHCGSPMDRDADGMARWRDGIRLLASAPNVIVKISDPVAYDPAWTLDSLRAIVLHCIDCFGPTRTVFGSDYPVANLHIGFAEWLRVLSAITRHFSRDERTAMFSGNAHRIYRF